MAPTFVAITKTMGKCSLLFGAHTECSERSMNSGIYEWVMDFTLKLQLSYSSALRIFHAWDLHWNRLPGKVVESLSLEVFKSHGDVAQRDVVIEHGGGGLGFEVYSNFNDSMIA